VTNSCDTLPSGVSSQQFAETTLRNVAGSRSLPRAKRVLDVFIAAMSLLALSPLLALLAIAVRLDSRGPILHVSRRLSRNGRVFACLKFRTMTSGETVTRFGSFLRRYALDELPQFVNVLRGEMSIVGPRPLLAPSQAAAPTVGSKAPNSRLPRLQMNPGMTGLWAIQEPEYKPRTAYISPDDTYRIHWSLWLDITILFRSTAAALAGRAR
jgi:lipopolysaccharide/colanic/teichoic acid biosynthesis glycosyltransferase